jgi:hypothetical protein
MNTQQLVNYYANLLILQYIGQVRAYATVQANAVPLLMPQVTVNTITFSPAPTSGTFELSYEGAPTIAMNWNASASTIQTDLQNIAGLGSVTVSGSIASGSLVVTFTGVEPVASLLVVSANSLMEGGNAVVPVVTETDVQLPLTVQNAFNLIGSSTAIGVQLDILGKYAGVTRYGYGLNGAAITLDDADFLSFILMSIIKNSSGSSLATIQAFLAQYFADAILVFDYQDMRMSYFLNSNIGSQQLAQIFITSNTLPVPMGVQIGSIIYTPNLFTLFGFRTYELPGYNISPFNSYASYNMDYPWLTYADALNP